MNLEVKGEPTYVLTFSEEELRILIAAIYTVSWSSCRDHVREFLNNLWEVGGSAAGFPEGDELGENVRSLIPEVDS